MPIGESLTVVIVLLFADAYGCEDDVDVGNMVDVAEARAGSCSKAEVIRNNCQRGCACAPLWIGYFFPSPLGGCCTIQISRIPCRLQE